MQKTDNDKRLSGDDEAAFLLDDYESDDDQAPSNKGGSASTASKLGLSAETQALMHKLGYSSSKEDDVDDLEDELKVFFCSRTHSQLSQFVHELRRVKMPPSIQLGDEDKSEQPITLSDEIKHLTLGSRKNLCINAKVKKLGNTTAINEKCLELQQSNTPSESKCPHLPNKENEALMHDFRDYSLAKIRDIEDLGKLGSRIGICPYYASRTAISPSEVGSNLASLFPKI